MNGRFSEFFRSLSKDPNEKGKEFEKFARWFFISDPAWKTQIKRVCRFEDWPFAWSKYIGTDQILQDRNDNYWAVQAKFLIVKTL